eukprot:Hpha_TRINITY_DN16488_c1_g1::TRINITY_DN16488_c1_g1_i1::g.163174::m.163174
MASATTVAGGLLTVGGLARCALALQAWDPAHRHQFLEWMGISFATSAVVIRVFRALTRRLQPKTYEEKPERRVVWAATGLSLLWPSWAVPIAVWASLRQNYSGGFDVNMASEEGIRIGCGISLGYMLYDFFDLAWWNKADYMKASGKALWKQMFLHHLFSLLFWPYGLASAKAVYPVGYFLFTEITNIGMNLRWFLNETNHKLLVPVSLVWIAMFAAVRIIPAPVLLYQLALGDYSKWDYFEKMLLAFCLIPVGLNFFWFKLIITGAIKKLCGGKRKKPDDAKDK